MLELYHHGSSVCAAKVRLYLHEKELEWDGHYIDILAGDQFDPEYLKLNPKAVVPTLVHDENVVCDSTVICEYLDDVYTDRPVRPEDPMARVLVKYWSKAVDENLHPACGNLTFMASHRITIQRLGPEGVKEFLDSTPQFSVTADWHNRKKAIVRDGFKVEGGEKMVRLYDTYLGKMEEALAAGSDWLVGDTYSYADISMTPYVTRLDMLSMDGMWKNGRLPKVEDWYERVKDRPSYQDCLVKWIPDQLLNDMKTNGAESWQEVKRILDIN